jgi:uncharacterized protein YfdQ (DUF2303 family)
MATTTNPPQPGPPPPAGELAAGIAAAIEAGKNLTAVLSLPGLKTVASIPGPAKIVEIPERKLEQPRFLTACPEFQEPQGFIEYVNRFKDDGSRIFAQRSGRFEAVLDYHDRADDPRHGDHRAVLSLTKSPEWSAWIGAAGKKFTQQEFAEFLEEHASDIVPTEPDMPDARTMLMVATKLRGTVGATFKHAKNLANGETQAVWEETVQGQVIGSDATVPGRFGLGLRPFIGCDRYPVECLLRWRVGGEGLQFFFKALRTEPIIEETIDTVSGWICDGRLAGKPDDVARALLYLGTGIRPALGTHQQEAYARGQ